MNVLFPAFWWRLPKPPWPTSEAHVIPRIPSQADWWSGQVRSCFTVFFKDLKYTKRIKNKNTGEKCNNCLSPPEGSLQLWRTSAVKSSRAARAILPGRRGSALSVSPVPSHWTDRYGRQRPGALFPVPWWVIFGWDPVSGCSPRNTDTWTTSCLRTTPLPTASWTSGERPAVSGWATCTAGSPSTKTSRWASELRLPPSTSLHRWTACFSLQGLFPIVSHWNTVLPVALGNLVLPVMLQNATQNSLELIDDPKAAAVDEIAAKLGLCKVRISCFVLFLHLTLFQQCLTPCLWRSGGLDLFRPAVRRYEDRNCPLHQKQGEDVAAASSWAASSHSTCYFLSCSEYKCDSCLCQDSYYMSAEECITAGYFQNLHSNPCRLSRDGHFGSKFVTVLATGRFYCCCRCRCCCCRRHSRTKVGDTGWFLNKQFWSITDNFQPCLYC